MGDRFDRIVRAFRRRHQRQQFGLGLPNDLAADAEPIIEAAQRLGQGLVNLARGGIERHQQMFGRGDGMRRHFVAGLQRLGHRIGGSAERTDRRGQRLGALHALVMQRFERVGNARKPLVDFFDDRVAGRALIGKAGGDAVDQGFDLGDARGQAFGAVARGALERCLVGAEHRQHCLALRGDALARFVDGVGGAAEQAIDRLRHVARDLFQPRARCLAGHFHAGDVRGELLRGTVGDRIGFAPTLGQRGELRIERRGMFARGNAGCLEQLRQPVGLVMRARQQRQQHFQPSMRLVRCRRQGRRMGIGGRDLRGQARPDRGHSRNRAIAQRHQGIGLLGQVGAIAFDTVGEGRDGAFKAGSLGAHRLCRLPEATRLRRAGAQRQHQQNRDQGWRHAQPGDEIDQRRRRQRGQAVPRQPQHRTDPPQRCEHPQDGEPRHRPRRRSIVNYLGQFDGILRHGRKLRHRHTLFRVGLGGWRGAVRPQVYDARTPVHHACLSRKSSVQSE
ncbi:hypothetical protein D9M73_98270 [compost metagenome]